MMPGSGNFLSTLHEAAAERLGSVFLREPNGDEITYGVMFDRAARLARVLHDHGVAPGDRVVVQVAKSPDAVALYLACLHTGAVQVPLNPAFTAEELEYFIGDADPALVVLDSTATGRVEIGELVSAADRAEPLALVDRSGDDLATLLYTSGTTGQPKGASLSHANLWHNAHALHEVWRFGPSDHLLHTLPLFHVHGLFVALHCAMLSAIPVTFLRKFDADQVIAALPTATVLMGVPTHYNRLLDDPRFDRELTADVRLFTCGSAPLRDAVFKQFTARTGHHICERYGMSEAGIMTSNPYDGDRIAGTVGFALRDVEIRICDDTGNELPAGQTGIVEVRGPHLFRGYWQRPQATAAATRDDGWFVSGDVGSVDLEGRVTLQGRSGDMIISGGENIYPKEIEIVLDDVDGVVESAVIGVPHPDFGEAVVAVLVVETGPGSTGFADQGVDDALAERLARFKHPKRRLVVDALPRNAMGKVQKSALRDRYASLFATS